MANNTTGFTRIIKAAGYSWKGLRAAWINEAAFRQEGWITLPDFDKSLVYCAVYGSKIAFCCIYSQHNCIYTQGAE